MQGMLNNPQFLQQMSSMLSNPAIMDQIIAMDPRLAAMSPQVRATFQDERFRQIMYASQSLIIPDINRIYTVPILKHFNRCYGCQICYAMQALEVVAALECPSATLLRSRHRALPAQIPLQGHQQLFLPLPQRPRMEPTGDNTST
jgi:hypothetical protein